MSLQSVTSPAVEPVTLAEAKTHLKVETGDDDALIGTLITAARARAEAFLGRALITQSFTLWLDRWPLSNCVEIPLPPLQAVTALTTYAMDGTAAVLDASLYQLDIASTPARLSLTAMLPAGLRTLNAIAIAFTAGYGDGEEDVPAPIRTAIMEMVGDLYANRGDEKSIVPVPPSLMPYRVVRL